MSLRFGALFLLGCVGAIKIPVGPYTFKISTFAQPKVSWRKLPSAPAPKRPYALFFDGEPPAPNLDTDVATSVARAPTPTMQESPAVDTPPATLDELLDTPLLDPFSPSSNRWMAKFKQLVREDYLTAETLYAGAVLQLGVFVGMQMVSMYIDAQPVVESCVNVYCQGSMWN